MVSPVLTMRPQPNNVWTSILFHMSRVVTRVDQLLGKTYNSLGLSSSQDDMEDCSRWIETTEG